MKAWAPSQPSVFSLPNKKMKRFLSFLLPVFMAACTVEPPLALDASGNSVKMDKQFYEGLKAANSEKSVPLERALDALGYQVVESVLLTGKDGAERTIPWDAFGSGTAWAGSDTLWINGQEIRFHELRATQDKRLQQIGFRTEQVANALLQAFGLAILPGAAQGFKLPAAQQAVLVFIDGLGYLDLQQALQDGIAPTLSQLPPAYLGLSTYPSITRVFSAALLSGLPPLENGVSYKSGRQLKADSMLDVMRENGKSVVLVEGNALYLNDLNDGDLRLTPDSDNDGYTDEETCRAGLSALAQNPDFLWVHLHGVDDAGHDSGRYSQQVQERILYADGCLGEIWNTMPSGSLLLVFSDHGMHSTGVEGRVGEHGTLMAQDRYNFLTFTRKP